MTPRKRIFFNVLASHGRSVFVLLCSFLTSRWALAVLGAEDYGLLGLIAGLVVLVTLVNDTLARSVCRFFAISIGRQDGQAEGGEECCRWFNLAVVVHLVLAGVLMVIGYPIMVYCIRHYLSIPPEKVSDCIAVWRWVCVSAFISMVCVPFRALYTAYQYIAELTVYQVLQTTAYVGALYYMLVHPGDWFVWVAMWLCFQGSFVSIAIAVRALIRFPECRFRLGYMLDFSRLRELAKFSGWEFLGAYSFACRNQGMALLVNKCYGVGMNAPFAISMSLAGRAQTFANEVDGAFSPAISTAYGQEDRHSVQTLSLACCKYSTCLVVLIAMPMVLVMDDFLTFWLVNPPLHTAEICICITFSYVIDKLTNGLHYAILASGQNRQLQLSIGICYILTVVSAFLAWACGMGIDAVGGAFIVSSFFICCFRIALAKRLLQIHAVQWCRVVLVPIVVTVLLSSLLPVLLRICVASGLGRIVFLPMTFVLVFVGLGWHFILSGDERARVWSGVESRIRDLLTEKTKDSAVQKAG